MFSWYLVIVFAFGAYPMQHTGFSVGPFNGHEACMNAAAELHLPADATATCVTSNWQSKP
jgi:hypothetical protein